MFIHCWTHGMRAKALLLHKMFALRWDLTKRRGYCQLLNNVPYDGVDLTLHLLDVLCAGHDRSTYAEMLFACIGYSLRAGKTDVADAFYGVLGTVDRGWLQERAITAEYRTLARAFKMDALEWMKSKFGIPRQGERSRMIKCVAYACMYGELDVVKWLVRNFSISCLDCRSVKDSLPYRRAKSARQRGIMAWLTKTFAREDREERAAVERQAASRAACMSAGTGELGVAPQLCAYGADINPFGQGIIPCHNI
jgi:hypothetical protein